MTANQQVRSRRQAALVVDDDPQLRSVLARQLQALGFEDVDLAVDGSAGLRAVVAADPSFDVVVCDLHMPNEGNYLLD
jgi:CheY-like chemotaxis protein